MLKKIAIAITASTFAATLTACSGAGVNAPTRIISQVTDGVEANLDKDGNLIYLRNVYINLNEAGDAILIGTIINQIATEDALIALAFGDEQIKIEPIPVLLNKPVTFGGDSANAFATIPNSGLVAGKRTTVSFFFGLAGSVTLDALVIAA